MNRWLETYGTGRFTRELVAYIVVTGLLGFYVAASVFKGSPLPDFYTTALYVIFGFIGQHLVIQVSHGNYLSLGDPVTFAALWCYGPKLALLTLVPAALIQFFTQKRAFLNCFFNAGQYTLSTVAAGGVIALTLKVSGTEAPLESIVAVLLSVFVFDMVNMMFVATALSIDTEKPLLLVFGNAAYGDRKNSVVLWYLINVASALLASYMGKPGMIFVFLSVLSLYLQFKFEQEHLRRSREAETDALTGLYNVRYMEDWISKECARVASQEAHEVKTPSNCSIIFIDVDGMKNVNDSLGHEVGDAVLVHLASLLKSVVRSTDKVVRYGGDEFVVICENASTEEAQIIAKRILETSMAQPLMQNGTLAQYGISLGVASYPKHGEFGRDLIRLGDKAMYIAKRSGGNAICTADDL